jgi:hypothetical protein
VLSCCSGLLQVKGGSIIFFWGGDEHIKFVSLEIRLNSPKIVKTPVWTILLYGSETWTLKKEDNRKLEALGALVKDGKD